MAIGKKTGGRPKDSINVKTKALWDLVDQTGLNPIQVVWAFCFNQHEALGYDSATVVKAARNGETYEEDRILAKDRLDAAKFLCNKMYPDLKSMELHGDSEKDPIRINHHADMHELIKIARGTKSK